jgi:long-chain acyl-CoA synthetase
MTRLPELVKISAGRYPDAPALAAVPGVAAGWSYAQLCGLMERGAAGLRGTGLSPGDRVLLLLESCAAWPAAFFAILEAGLVAVPLPAQTPAAAAAALAAFAGARASVVSEGTLTRAPPGLPCVRVERLLQADPSPTATGPGPTTELALLAFTSGCTAKPRAVELTHANLLGNLEGLLRVRRAGPGDSFLSMLPPAHLFELTVGLLGPLACGARVYYAPSPMPQRLLAALRDERITHALSVPALLEVLYQEVLSDLVDAGVVDADRRDQGPAETARRLREEMDDADRARLRAAVRARVGQTWHTLVVGGAALDPAWADVTAAVGLSLEVGYGLTEAGPVVSLALASEAPPGSAGRPLPDVEVRLAPDGEILVRGPGVMRGYFRDPGATAAALRDGWLHTGDHGHLDAEGFLFITGRLKEALVTAAGETLYPEEVEPYYDSPLFAERCVAALPGPQGNDVPALFVVPASADVAEQDLRRAFEELRAAAPARLRVTELVRLDRPLPRTALGKIRRRSLAEQCRGHVAAT